MTGPIQRPPTDRERQLLQLALRSPKRGEPYRAPLDQADAAHLPLFVAANEPRLI